MLKEEFNRDLRLAQDAEILVTLLLRGATDAYTFDWVGDNPNYYSKGDIIATDKATGEQFFIEVKDDSRIAETGNILCEEEVEYYDGDYSKRGNIYNDYNFYVVVSKQAREIYILEGEALKANYKRGRKTYIPHKTQATSAYLLPLGVMRREGGLLATISYDLESRQARVAA